MAVIHPAFVRLGLPAAVLPLAFSLGVFVGAGDRSAVAQQSTENPHGESFDVSCAACHTTSSWTPLKDPIEYDHGETGFALEAGHGTADCKACHESLVFEYVASSCVDCHADPHRGEVGVDCQGCHSIQGWQDNRQMFVFHFTTRFPLLGGHANVDCDSCHQAAPPFEFSNTPTDCYSCHRADYEEVTDPDHAALGFPRDCELCHTVDDWNSETVFDHDQFFVLEGRHASLGCESCHSEQFAGTSTDCYDCHQQAFEQTTDPDHEQLAFPTDCELCHTADRWGGAQFADHEQFWPLTGAHAALDCSECHADGFAGTATDCVACHQRDYDRTKDPDHAAAGFGTQCENCHTTSTWQGAEFDHDALFPLRGAHRRLDCEACHSKGFAGTPTDCYDCHRKDYRETTNPDHRAAGFPTDCEVCHNDKRWQDAVFDHGVFFPLRGAHAQLDCEQCHADGFAGTPTDCYSCHQQEYDKTKDPDHQAAGFPTDCEVCHNEKNWNDAVFDHDVFFPLVGAHKPLDCEQCHADGFAGTPTDCYSCHQRDFEKASDPDHVRSGFPTDCDLCHTQDRWEGASFVDHDALYFPIYSGKHNNKWDACTDCHTNQNDFTTFECINCHEHNEQKMADKHKGVSGYQWVSTLCLQCHPNGDEGGGDRLFGHRRWRP